MNHVFMTGGTGVIGSALIPRLLSMPNTYLTALVRAASNAELEVRRSQLLDFCGIRDKEMSGRIHFVIGDVCEDQLGVSNNEYEQLLRRVSTIVHCAGNVKLNQSIGAARRNACQATSEILTLARRAKRLRKVDVVSTIGVAGRLPGVIPEQRISEPREYHNNYEQAKAEAEHLLWNGIDEDLPITIHRPSMVVGDSRTGEVAHYQVFYYLCDFLSGRRTHGILPAFGEASLDIVPSDYVADVISHSAGDQSTVGRVLHLCSGDLPELRLSALSEAIGNIYETLGKPCPPRRELSLAMFRRLAYTIAWLGPAPLRKAARTLPYFLTYLLQQQQFSVTDIRRYAGTAGIRQPNVREYLPRILAPYLASVCNPLRARPRPVPELAICEPLSSQSAPQS